MSRRENVLWALLGAVLALVPLAVLYAASEPAHGAERRDGATASTRPWIEEVHGKRSTGFTIVRSDGSEAGYPPLRMALMECRDGLDTEGQAAYDRCVDRTWLQYDTFVEMRRTLNHKGVNR